MLSVCILHGFGEGPHVSERFRQALLDKGYLIAASPDQADILITHSGGHLLVPKAIAAKQVIHIAPYYWPGKPWFACMRQKLADDFRSHRKAKDLRFWAGKTIWNFIYACKMPTNVRMLGVIRKEGKWRHGGVALVVRPRYDSFCHPDPKRMPFDTDPAFLSMPGYHDDCWRNPAPYIALIQS